MLYLFRTPPGVRVGRAPIDEDAIRLLEENNPDIQFDWTRILKTPATPGEASRRGGDHRETGREHLRDHRDRGGPPPPSAHRTPQPPDEREPKRAETAEPGETSEPTPQEALDLQEPQEPSSLSVPPPSLAPRYARIGAEGLARLRARYAEVMARISERPLDEAAREQLRTKAERLNPDSWVTDDDVAAALERYETVFEELRSVVGRAPHRRRRRRV